MGRIFINLFFYTIQVDLKNKKTKTFKIQPIKDKRFSLSNYMKKKILFKEFPISYLCSL